MERYDARKETFEEIEIFDTLALFSSGRIQRESVPKGFYCYEVRHDDECMGIPCELSSHVLVNFWGTVISKVSLINNGEDPLRLHIEKCIWRYWWIISIRIGKSYYLFESCKICNKSKTKNREKM